MSREINITKDMWTAHSFKAKDLEGVYIKSQLYLYKILTCQVGIVEYRDIEMQCNTTGTLSELIGSLKTGYLEIITPKERPDLYGIEKVTEKPKNIDCEYPNCDFTKTVYIDTGREVLKVDPEDIIIVRKNQVCFVNKQTDSLQDAMVSDCSNNAPAVTLDNLVLELCDYYPSRQALVSALVNLKVIDVKDDYSEELANVKGLFSGKEKHVR